MLAVPPAADSRAGTGLVSGRPVGQLRSRVSTASTRRLTSGDGSSPSLRKIWAQAASTVRSLSLSRCGDGGVGPPLGHQGEDLALAVGEPSSGSARRGAPQQPRHDRRVDDALAVRTRCRASTRTATSDTRSLSR